MFEFDVVVVIQRVDVIFFGILVEMNYFQRERVVDYKDMM